VDHATYLVTLDYNLFIPNMSKNLSPFAKMQTNNADNVDLNHQLPCYELSKDLKRADVLNTYY
jgi:hypothetical protein